MPAPKGNKNAAGNKGGGRPTVYKAEYVKIAAKLYELGATDYEVAQAFEVSEGTIRNWQAKHIEFSTAAKNGKTLNDDRVERSLYHKAVGYTFTSEKVFQFQGQIVRAQTVEHVPPDTTAAIFWLKNRRKEDWRDRQELSGPNGGPLQILDMSRVSEEKLRDLAAAGLSGIGAARAGQASAD